MKFVFWRTDLPVYDVAGVLLSGCHVEVDHVFVRFLSLNCLPCQTARPRRPPTATAAVHYPTALPHGVNSRQWSRVID